MEPKVNLINWTPRPIETMAFVRRIMHSPVPDSLTEFEENSEKVLDMNINDYIDKILIKDGMPTFLEYVHFTFKIDNVSRALTHQLVRHRVGCSYSQQSMRCVKVPEFAQSNLFHMPPSVKNKEQYKEMMENIEDMYNCLLEEEESTEDARGILPMNIGTSIIVGVTMRALTGIINKRLCLKTQAEFQKVAHLMMREIEKADKRLLKWFGAPCDLYGKCMMEAECAQQLEESKLKGQQQTEYVCPKYLKLIERRKKNG